MKKGTRYISAVFLLLFGAVTLFMSSSVIFDWFGIRAKEGNYVLFVVWANWLCAYIYFVSVYGFLKMTSWTFKTLSVATVILLVALTGLFVHIYSGGIYETKTVFAMLFRISVTIAFTAIAYFLINKKK